ncbi:MAG: hypothetical protein ABJA78_14270, partial [Ferruginibacter sp.]
MNNLAITSDHINDHEQHTNGLRNSHPKFTVRLIRLMMLVLMTAAIAFQATAQTDDDISTAETYAKKFKDNDILCTNSYQQFTFD